MKRILWAKGIEREGDNLSEDFRQGFNTGGYFVALVLSSLILFGAIGGTLADHLYGVSAGVAVWWILYLSTRRRIFLSMNQRSVKFREKRL